MKIYTRVVYEWRDGKPTIVEADTIDYTGQIAKCGGITMAAILPSLLGGVAATAIGSMMSSEAPTPQAAPPAIEAPTTMPAPNDQERRAAARRSVALQMSRRGRASTILTDDADARLGG